MKAYTRNKFSPKLAKAIDETALLVLRQKEADMVERIIKAVCAELYTGIRVPTRKEPVRLSRNTVGSLAMQLTTDMLKQPETYWAKVDSIVIDELELPFKRTVTDYDGLPVD